MSNKSKAKGTRAETAVVKFLEEHGIKAARQPLAGSNDIGDVRLPDHGIVIEVKAGKQTVAPNRTQLAEWFRQACEEAANWGCSGALVISRYNRKLADADVYVPIVGQEKDMYPGIMGHMFLDEYAEALKK